MSTWAKTRDVIAFVGVVASLVFVGLEIRQNTAATRGQTRQELTAINQEWLTLLSGDREFHDLFVGYWELGAAVDELEQNRAELMMVMNVRRLENVFFQYQEGLVDETALRSYGLQNWDLSTPRMRDWWVEENWRAAFHPDFVRFLEGVQVVR